MYMIKEVAIGDVIKEYRERKNYTQEELGNLIYKSKGTISKYEKNMVVPDVFTLVEIFNILNIKISTFLDENDDEIQIENINPFNVKKIYMYYLTMNKLIESKIEIKKENNKYKAELYRGNRKDKRKWAFSYDGVISSDSTMSYLDFQNTNNVNNAKGKIQLMVNLPWDGNNDLYNGIYTGRSRNGLPEVKKVLLSKNRMNDVNEYEDKLKFSKFELKKIGRENSYTLLNNELDF